MTIIKYQEISYQDNQYGEISVVGWDDYISRPSLLPIWLIQPKHCWINLFTDKNEENGSERFMNRIN